MGDGWVGGRTDEGRGRRRQKPGGWADAPGGVPGAAGRWAGPGRQWAPCGSETSRLERTLPGSPGLAPGGPSCPCPAPAPLRPSACLAGSAPRWLHPRRLPMAPPLAGSAPRCPTALRAGAQWASSPGCDTCTSYLLCACPEERWSCRPGTAHARARVCVCVCVSLDKRMGPTACGGPSSGPALRDPWRSHRLTLLGHQRWRSGRRRCSLGSQPVGGGRLQSSSHAVAATLLWAGSVPWAREAGALR